MGTVATRILALIPTLAFGMALASEKPLFSVEGDRIRQIAFRAVLERYPDLGADKLIESGTFVVWCMSAYELGYVSAISEDFDYCHAAIRYEIDGSSNTRQYLGDDGFCYEETETESIKVKVFSNESTEVQPRGIGAGRRQIECTAELEGWSR